MLYEHQKQAVKRAIENYGSLFLIWDVGTGKTRATIEIFRELKNRFSETKLLVICPISLIESGWMKEAEFSDFKACNLREGFVDADVYIINYESLLTKKLYIIESLIEKYPFMCALDESSRMKSYSSKTTKKLLSISHKFIARVCLSATPCPNDETEIWAQAQFVKSGVVHPNFFAFRNQYFHLQRGKQILNGVIITKSSARDLFSKGFKYEITPAKRKELMDRLSPYCHYVKKEDVLDLPEQIDQFRYIELPDELMKLYKQMRDELVVYIREYGIAAANALTKVGKLRQITSGFVMSEGAVVLSQEGNGPKLTELLNIIQELGKSQAIIWCEYQEEIRQVMKALGERAVSLYGETKDREESIRKFQSGEVQYLVAHPRSAGHGLNFQNASYEIFYSLSYSWEMYEQSRGRIHRSGQRNNCVYIHIIAKKTIDEIILSVLKRKGSEQEIMLELLNV